MKELCDLREAALEIQMGAMHKDECDIKNCGLQSVLTRLLTLNSEHFTRTQRPSGVMSFTKGVILLWMTTKKALHPGPGQNRRYEYEPAKRPPSSKLSLLSRPSTSEINRILQSLWYSSTLLINADCASVSANFPPALIQSTTHFSFFHGLVCQRPLT